MNLFKYNLHKTTFIKNGAQPIVSANSLPGAILPVSGWANLATNGIT